MPLCLLSVIGWAAALPAQTRDSSWSVALTFDDLPMTGGGGAACASSEIGAVNDAILDALRAARAPAVGFVIPGSPCVGEGATSVRGVTEQWLLAGHWIGNHSFSHRDYNDLTASAYLADIERAHRVLEPLIQARQSQRWYRPPLLHAGPDSLRRAALERWLEANGYEMGVVTIDNQEWVYAAAYARARAAARRDVMARVGDAYVAHLSAATSYSRGISEQLFGRDVPQVLLLHVNRLNADLLPSVIAMLRGTGARFVSLDEAMRDSAYATDNGYVGRQGLSWLRRWAVARGVAVPEEPREESWVANYASRGVLPDSIR